MNKIIYLLTGLWLFAMVSCQSEQVSQAPTPSTTKPTVPIENKRGPIRVSGNILNVGNPNIKLSHKSTNLNGAIRDGKFIIDMMIGEPGIYQLSYNGQKIPLFLRPNDEVVVDFDALKIANTIQFSGTDSKPQKYLYLKSQNDPLSYTQKRKIATLSEADFMVQADQTREKETTFFEKYKKENINLSADFILFEETEIKYSWAKQYNDYSLYRAFYNQQEAYTPSPELLKFRKELNLNNDQLMVSETYRDYLISHVGQAASKLVQKDLMNGGKIQSSLRTFEIVEKEHNNTIVKNFLLYTFFKQHLKSKGVNDSDALYQRFKKEVSNPRYLAEIDEAFSAWKHLLAGQPAPLFAYPDAKGKKVSLDDLKGKVVYVDVWATWCGPCKIEIPHLEKLQEKFHNQPVAFVSVSIDKNAPAWEKMVKEKNMTGIQLLADQAGNSQICKDYKIQGIPRFLLIDQAGNIVNAQADRPSAGTVAGAIEGLLKGNWG